ncbi:MAG TPA: Rrf2 family transcriptional regulator [Oligoflexia bacterium]|nr:Rrf2 family transcriptional regulator [Oligoflexia bacterium]HMP47865.1 Rrf2 family transcriptional regulator [Oligoflexia bacterium]
MQRITQWGEYGVHATLFIARRQAEGAKLVSAQEVSDSQSISLNYTQQILVKLREGGIIESERGPKGGYRLSRDPISITLKDILESSEGDTMSIICEARPLDMDRCSPEAECWLRSVWIGLKDSINSYLESITLDSLLKKMNRSGSVNIVNLPLSDSSKNPDDKIRVGE